VGACGLLCQAARQRQPAGGENASRFANHKARDDTERHGSQQLGKHQSRERDPGIGKGEQRQDRQGNPGMQLLLEALE
jgi:hypothetical protein